MTLSKRILAGICAAAFCLGFASCGSTDGKDSKKAKGTESGQSASGEDAEGGKDTESKSSKTVELTSEQKEKVAPFMEDLPDIELENKKIKFISHWDMNPADGGELALKLQLFKEKYQGEVEYVPTTWTTRYDDITTLVLAKNSPDFFPAGDNDGFPVGALKGIFQPVDDYIDFASDLWNTEKIHSAVDMFKFDGKHYVAATGSSPNLVCIYNTKTIKENGLEDPAELYKNGEWTWSKFKEMCEKFTDASQEKYGLDGYWFDQAINNSAGVPLISVDSSGRAVSNLNNEKVVKAQNFMYSLHESGVYFPRENNNKMSRGGGETGNGVGDGLTLFIPCGFWSIENTPENVTLWGDVTAGEIMFVPMPCPDDDKTYYIDSRLENGYFLIKNAPNPKGFAAFMNCEVVASNNTAEDDAVHRDSYGWNDDMINMKKEICDLCSNSENVVFDFKKGVSDEITRLIGGDKVNGKDGENIQTLTMNCSNTMKWEDVLKKYEDKVNYEIKQANSQLPEV